MIYIYIYIYTEHRLRMVKLKALVGAQQLRNFIRSPVTSRNLKITHPYIHVSKILSYTRYVRFKCLHAIISKKNVSDETFVRASCMSRSSMSQWSSEV